MCDISIIIPTRNRSEIIEICLSALVEEIQSNVEVLIIDTSSNDETKLIARKYHQFNYYFVGDIPYSMVISRNYGLKKANGEIIVFIDDDCIVQKNWLSSLTFPFNDPEVVATGGRVIHHPWKIPNQGAPVAFLDFENAKIWAEWDRVIQDVIEVDHLPGGNCAFRRDRALEIGGFDPNFTYSANLEETDFFYRLSKLGGKLLFVPYAVVEHRAAQRQDHLDRSQTNYLWRFSFVRNKIYFFRKHRLYRSVRKTTGQVLLDVCAYIITQTINTIIFSVATIHGLISGLLSRIS